MLLVALSQALQDLDGVVCRGLVDVYGGESSLQGGILLDVLAVFVESGCTDGLQLAASQRGLEHVGGIHRALRRARTNDGVQLINKQNYLALVLADCVHHGAQTLLELAAELRAREHRAEVEREHALVAQRLRHVVCSYRLCESLHDCRLAHARLTDEHGVVLSTTG